MKMEPEYVLISERMIEEILARIRSSGVGVQGAQVRAPFVSVNLGKKQVPAGLPSLAEQVTEVVADHTGTPEHPGQYIGVRANFLGWLWTSQRRTPVAWLVAQDEESLILLCGSGRNVVGYDAPDQQKGWRPSHPMGLAEFVALLRWKDPKRLLGFEANTSEEMEMADAAVYITSGLTEHSPPEIDRELDALFKPYVYVRHFAGRHAPLASPAHGYYERVIVGAPLWAREPTDGPPPGVK